MPNSGKPEFGRERERTESAAPLYTNRTLVGQAGNDERDKSWACAAEHAPAAEQTDASIDGNCAPHAVIFVGDIVPHA